MREGWEMRKLGDVADRVIGRTPPRNDPRYWTQDTTNPFCSIADMTSARVDPFREGVTELAIAEGKAKRVPAGSLIMSFKLSIGKLGFTERDLFPNEAICWLNPHSEIMAKYLAYALENQDLTVGSSAAVKGKTLNSDSLDAIPIPVPPMTEQKRIVDLISTADEAIEAASSKITKTSSVLEQLLVQINLTCSNKRLLGDLFDLRYGKALKAGDRGGGHIPVFGAAGEVGRHTSATSTPDEAVLVVGRKGVDSRSSLPVPLLNGPTLDNTGYSGWGGAGSIRYSDDPVWVIDTAYQAVPKTSMDQRAAYWSLIIADLPRVCTTTTLPGLNRDSAYAVPIVDPSSITSEILDTLSALDAACASGLDNLGNLRNLRSQLLSSLISGHHQIPDSYDELLNLQPELVSA